MADLSQKQLEEMVTGKPADPYVTFHDQSVLDIPASKAAGRRVWKEQLFITRKYPGVSDYIAKRASQQDIDQHPVEYQQYLASKESNAPSVLLIPGMTQSHANELRDLGITTIEHLADANAVPPEFAKYQRLATVLFEAMEEDNAEEEITKKGITEAGPAPVGRHDLDHVDELVTAGGGGRRSGEAPEGNQATRRLDDHQREKGLRPAARPGEFDIMVVMQ